MQGKAQLEPAWAGGARPPKTMIGARGPWPHWPCWISQWARARASRIIFDCCFYSFFLLTFSLLSFFDA